MWIRNMRLRRWFAADTFIALVLFGTMLAGSPAYSEAAKEKAAMSVEKSVYGAMPDGQAVDRYVLTNGRGMRVAVITYGGIVTSIDAPDREGNLGDVVLGCADLAGYLDGHPYFGALIGRVGNRIGKGRFSLDGVEYTLAINNGENALHGGLKGFDKVVWEAEAIEAADGFGIKLSYRSPDGEEGYPGTMDVEVTYILTAGNALKILYRATADRATPLNLTNHSYFNLAGQGNGDILGHEMTINADHFTPVDETLIPTGEIRAVAGTPLDFTKPAAIGARVNENEEQMNYGGGYDHNYVLNKEKAGTLTLAARVVEPTSGRVMEVHTTEPGVQFYCGNFLDGSLTGKGGKVYHKRYGFCLETQHYPDSPNKPEFPSAILRPGQTYAQETVYIFSAE